MSRSDPQFHFERNLRGQYLFFTDGQPERLPALQDFIKSFLKDPPILLWLDPDLPKSNLESDNFEQETVQLYFNKAGRLPDHFFSNPAKAIILHGTKANVEYLVRRLGGASRHSRVSIDLSAIGHNIRVLRQALAPKTRTMVMVKANAYGLGLEPVARYLKHIGVDYLGVAYTDEGVRLRESGIPGPIMIMNSLAEDFPLFQHYDLEPEVYSPEYWAALRSLAVKGSEKPVRFHLKLETGMNRLGWREEDLTEFIETYPAGENIILESVFSHLAAAGDSGEDDFTRQQQQRFNSMTQRLNQAGFTFWRHLANSDATARFPEMQYDLVRLGISAYGISSHLKKLKTVASFRVRVSQVKKLTKGETVSYGRRFKASQDMYIAVLAAGYGDGLMRLLSSKGFKVYAGNQFYPVVGVICMDMFMISLSDANLEPGDELEVFGKTQSIKVVADLAHTIPYELLTSLAPRLRRDYIVRISNAFN